MSATKEEIVKALAQLDSGNDAHWTDDGLPRVNVVQELTKDAGLTRKLINDAAPAFSRAGTEANKEPEDVQPGDPTSITMTPFDAPTDALKHDDSYDLDPQSPLADQLDEDHVRTVMERRVINAERRIEAARVAAQAAIDFVRKCERFHEKAKQDMNKRFPPIHPADAIKAHLQSQLQQRYEAVGAGHLGPASQVDAALAIRGKQGWARRAQSPRVA